jgi:hypothetical protein
MGTFIVAQAAWAVLLFIKVAGRWPSTAVKSWLGRVGTFLPRAEASPSPSAIPLTTTPSSRWK